MPSSIEKKTKSKNHLSNFFLYIYKKKARLHGKHISNDYDSIHHGEEWAKLSHSTAWNNFSLIINHHISTEMVPGPWAPCHDCCTRAFFLSMNRLGANSTVNCLLMTNISYDCESTNLPFGPVRMQSWDNEGIYRVVFGILMIVHGGIWLWYG